MHASGAPRRSFEQLLGVPALAMLQASLLARQGKPREAAAVLAKLPALDVGQDAEVLLLRAQLDAAFGNAQQALEHLSVGALPQHSLLARCGTASTEQQLLWATHVVHSLTRRHCGVEHPFA